MSYRAKMTKLYRTRTIFSLWKPGAIHVLVSACGTLACTVLSMHTRAKRSSFKVYSITSVPAQPVTRYGFRCWFLAAVTLSVSLLFHLIQWLRIFVPFSVASSHSSHCFASLSCCCCFTSSSAPYLQVNIQSIHRIIIIYVSYDRIALCSI